MGADKTWANRIILRQLFKEHYFKDGRRVVESIDDIPKREFAYTSFDLDSIARHKSFRGPKELQDFLVKNIPSNFYHSSGFYLFPEREMHQKEWLGATLIFDLDADHLHHRGVSPLILNLCEECDEIFESQDPCPQCGKETSKLDWITEKDLGIVKAETKRLLDILEGRLGFEASSMKAYFSGSRGYHIHVEDEELKELGQEERNEIVDYLMMVGYSLRHERDPKKSTFAHLLKVARGENVPNGLDKEEKKALLRLTKKLAGLAPNETVSSLNAELPKALASKVEEYVRRTEMVGVDPVVTTDIHRLIRAPYSLHNKTGLTKQKVEDIDSFDPFADAVGISSEPIEIFVRYAPRMIFKSDEYGPYRASRVRLPGYVAAYLLARGVAYAE